MSLNATNHLVEITETIHLPEKKKNNKTMKVYVYRL